MYSFNHCFIKLNTTTKLKEKRGRDDKLQTNQKDQNALNHKLYTSNAWLSGQGPESQFYPFQAFTLFLFSNLSSHYDSLSKISLLDYSHVYLKTILAVTNRLPTYDCSYSHSDFRYKCYIMPLRFQIGYMYSHLAIRCKFSILTFCIKVWTIIIKKLQISCVPPHHTPKFEKFSCLMETCLTET